MKSDKNKRLKKTSRNGERPKNLSLKQAAGVLKNFDLKELLKLSARLSLYEALTPETDPLSISLYFSHEEARMFSNLILQSGARRRRSSRLPFPEDLRAVLNACKAARDDPQELRQLQIANGTGNAHLAMQRFMARLSLIQISAQEPLPRFRAARLLAMLTIIPERFSDEIPGTERTKVLETLSKVETALGSPLSDLFRAFVILMHWQHVASINSQIAIRGRAPESTRNRSLATILSFLHPEPLLDDYLFFNCTRVASEFSKGSDGAIKRAENQLHGFLRLASKTHTELINLSHTETAFQAGHAGKRLSPLERYPIVELESPGAHLPPGYLIPNYRHFVSSFSKIIDFTLMELLGKEYAHARGALLHLYLQKLVQTRLPEIIFIPEISFQSKHGEKRSPDFTLIESATKTLIAVEVKGRALSFQARVTLNTSPLEELEDLYHAIGKLPGKIAALRAGRPEFAQWSSSIAETDKCLLLGVLREGSPVGMARLAREEARQDPQNPLNSVTDPFSVLAADTFERAIEKSARTGIPLSELLMEHYRVSGEYDYSRDETDMFGDRQLLEEASFARRLIDEQAR